MLPNRINRLTVRNYRSLADVTVDFDDLTVLVGANGSGKSNILDVLRFVRDAISKGLDVALQTRGGIDAILTYSPEGHFEDIEIALEFIFEEVKGSYSFILGRDEQSAYWVKNERAAFGSQNYEIRDGNLVESNQLIWHNKQLEKARLNLWKTTIPIDLTGFILYTWFYSIFPDALRNPQKPGDIYPLNEQGENLASVLRHLITRQSDQFRDEFYHALARIVPSITADNPITVDSLASFLIVKLKHTSGAEFDLSQESDGTVRVLSLLAAIYQIPPLPFIAIEEPELMIHPGALDTLSDIIIEASHRSQIVLTTHSPDMISRFPPRSLRIVELVDNGTKVGPVRPDRLQVINDQLFSSGDLLRIGGLSRD